MLEFDRIERENAAMREAIKEAHEALKKSEFSDILDGRPCCPDCATFQHDGHADTCVHASALAKLQPFIKP